MPATLSGSRPRWLGALAGFKELPRPRIQQADRNARCHRPGFAGLEAVSCCAGGKWKRRGGRGTGVRFHAATFKTSSATVQREREQGLAAENLRGMEGCFRCWPPRTDGTNEVHRFTMTGISRRHIGREDRCGMRSNGGRAPSMVVAPGDSGAACHGTCAAGEGRRDCWVVRSAGIEYSVSLFFSVVFLRCKGQVALQAGGVRIEGVQTTTRRQVDDRLHIFPDPWPALPACLPRARFQLLCMWEDHGPSV